MKKQKDGLSQRSNWSIQVNLAHEQRPLNHTIKYDEKSALTKI